MIVANKIVKRRDICKYCGKRKATQLCDMPQKVIVTSIGTDFVKTCDNPMCVECALKFREFEFCPDCVAELRTILN